MNRKKAVFVVFLAVLGISVWQIGQVYAIQYCDGDVSYNNITVNSQVIGVANNCSLQGLSCTDGVGCDVSQSYQWIVFGGIWFILFFLAVYVLKRRR